MELPLRIIRPFLGARILKTGIAVFLVLLAYHLVAHDYAAFAAVAAVLAVQPSVARAKEVFLQQLLGNLVGGAVGAALGYFLGATPLAMALGVIIVLGILPRVRLNDSANLAVVVVLFVMDRPEHDYWLYAGARVAAITGGMLIGYLVNRFVLPPRYTDRLRQELIETAESVDQFGQNLIGSLPHPHTYAKEQIKAEAGAIQKRLETARYILDLSVESDPQGQSHDVARKATASMFVFVERIMDVHKMVLQAGGLPAGPEHDLVKESLTAVMAYKRSVTAAALDKGQLSPETAETYRQALAKLEHLVSQLVDQHDRRPLGLTLHGVLTNIKHMGWRMDSLSRMLR